MEESAAEAPDIDSGIDSQPKSETESKEAKHIKDLLNEKFRLKERTKAAEKALEDYRTENDARRQSYHELKTKLEQYEFKEFKQSQLAELSSKLEPGQELDFTALAKVADKFTNKETFAQDLADVLPAFVKTSQPQPKVSAVPFQGTPNNTTNEPLEVNTFSLKDMSRLFSENPEMYKTLKKTK